MSVLQPAAAEPGTLAQSAAARARPSPGTRRRWQLLAVIAADFLSANAAFFIAYHLRYTYELGGDIAGESWVDYSTYVPLQLLFAALCLVGYQVRGSYSLSQSARFLPPALTMLGTTAVAAMAVFAFASMVQYAAFSRLTVIYAWLLAFALGMLGQLAIQTASYRAYRAGRGIQRVIVVGNNRLARMVMQVLANDGRLGCQVLGFVDDTEQLRFGRFPALGPLSQLPTLIEQLGVDRVIVALPAARHEEVLQILDRCRATGISLSLVPDLFELRLSHVNLETVGGIPLLDLRETGIGEWNSVLKRALDLGLSLAILVVLSPLLLVIAIAIKLDSRGPVFFAQTRLGKDGAPFTCLKFRSMRTGAEVEQAQLEIRNEAEGPIFKMRADPRLTRVGRALRRTSLDELPQLWNVLQGEMSLVGPRPPLPSEVERYQDWHRRRLEVVPGITGLWQVSGRSELAFDEMVMLDLYYIENWSLSLDLQILARTIPTVLAARGAF